MTTFRLKLRKIGNSVGLILPNEMLARLDVVAGKQLLAVETRNGYLLRPVNQAVGKQVEAGKQWMDQHSGVFDELAK